MLIRPSATSARAIYQVLTAGSFPRLIRPSACGALRLARPVSSARPTDPVWRLQGAVLGVAWLPQAHGSPRANPVTKRYGLVGNGRGTGRGMGVVSTACTRGVAAPRPAICAGRVLVAAAPESSLRCSQVVMTCRASTAGKDGLPRRGRLGPHAAAQSRAAVPRAAVPRAAVPPLAPSRSLTGWSCRS